MRAIQLQDRFVPRGAAGLVEPETAVSVGAGAIWMDVYAAVTTTAGRYVQGGGAPPSVSPAWCWAVGSAASPRGSAPPRRTCWRPRS